MREILFRGFHKDENGKETIYLDGKEIKGSGLMARELHKKKDKELYALYSTIVDDYITEFLPKEEIKKIWINDLIKEAKKKVDKYMEEVDKEVK